MELDLSLEKLSTEYHLQCSCFNVSKLWTVFYLYPMPRWYIKSLPFWTFDYCKLNEITLLEPSKPGTLFLTCNKFIIMVHVKVERLTTCTILVKTVGRQFLVSLLPPWQCWFFMVSEVKSSSSIAQMFQHCLGGRGDVKKALKEDHALLL